MAQPVTREPDGLRRILVVKLSSLGDVVHAIPAVAALARRHPRARIDWVVEPLAAPLARELPFVEEVIVAGARGAFADDWSAWSEEVAALRETLASRRYDLAVDLQGLLRSSLVTVLSEAARRVGRGRWPWLHSSVPMYDASTPHAIENTARAVAPLGIAPGAVFEEGLRAVAPLAGRLRDRGVALARDLGLPRRYRALLPGASRESKRLPLRSVELSRDLPLVVLGGADARGAGPDGATDLAGGLPLLDSVALALGAESALGADSGLSHLTAFLGGRIVGVFGPTRVSRVGLRGPRASSVAAGCGGCERRRCPRSRSCLAGALAGAAAFPGEVS